MINSRKKGFTLVELVIVIAVVAILAAVLIPTFSNLVKKANLSADEQAVRQMNTALAMYEAENGKPESLIEAKKALDEALVNVEGGLVPLTQGYAFYWDSASNKVVLVSSTTAIETNWLLMTSNGFGILKEVSSFNDFASAIGSSSNEAPVLIKLTEDITATGKIDVAEGNAVILDLNGKKITTKGEKYSSKICCIYVQRGGNLKLENGEIVLPSDGGRGIVNEEGTLLLDNVTIASESAAAIYVEGIGDTTIVDSKIDFKGTSYAITSNSLNDTADGSRINIIDTEINYEGPGAAIYIPTNAMTIIENSKIYVSNTATASQAIILMGTNMVIKNSTIKHEGTGTGMAWGNGVNKCPAGGIVINTGETGSKYSKYSTLTLENVTIEGTASPIVANVNRKNNITITGTNEVEWK